MITRALVDLREMLQKNRISFQLRIGAAERGADSLHPYHTRILESWLERFQELEAEVDQQLGQLGEEEAIIQMMMQVRGVGPILAMRVAALIDISRSDTVSALWRYAGYAVFDGERERLKKGEKAHFNRRLKTACYLVGNSLIKSNSPYRVVYDEAKEHYQLSHPDWTKAHIHMASLRKMIKIWLAHLWLVWRAIEGLPIRDPYVFDVLGHTHRYNPEDFGWPVKVTEKGSVQHASI